MAEKPDHAPLVSGPNGALAAGLAVVLIAACHSTGAAGDRPALIVDPDDASRTALEKTLSGLFGGHPVRLADDALTKSSQLTLEITPRHNLDGKSSPGRVVEPPYRFELVKHGEDCILIDMRDGKRYSLENTSCVAR